MLEWFHHQYYGFSSILFFSLCEEENKWIKKKIEEYSLGANKPNDTDS